MAKHAIFRSDSMAGTTQGKYLVSVRISEDLDNGCIVVPGEYEAGAREVRGCSAPEADTTIGQIAILGSEEVMPAKKFDTVGDFYNVAGSVARGYIFEHGDMFSVTKECVDGTPALGATFEVKAGSHKMNAVEAATGATVIGKCIAVEQDGATTWYVVRV